MNNNDISERVIENYQEQEKMMILIFAQWCTNNKLDPISIYKKAYPNQLKNDALIEALTLTVPRKEADHIDDETIINVLQLFGNDDLAFIVQEEIDQQKK